MTCEKRQRVVTRGPSGSKESFRCINVKCDMMGENVTDDQCSQCPLAVVFKKRPCNKIPEPCDDCRKAEKELAKKHKDSIKVPEFPAIHLQLISWKEAIRKWREAGKPKRSDEEVKAILETHCKGCSWYDADKRRCKGCGCKVTDGGVAVFNKIRMATEHCPRDFW